MNDRLGREQELREKLKATVERYENVFGKQLTVGNLKDYLDEEEKKNKLDFLRGRMGLLSDTDIGYMRNILKENAKAPNTASPKVVSALTDIDEDEIEEDNEEN